MENECLFCRMERGDIPTTRLHDDEHAFAIRDINPLAPTHILIIPKRHIDSVRALSDDDAALVGHLTLTAKRLAEAEGVAENGYRLVFNVGPDGGQSVYHLHLHLLGGRRLGPSA